MSATLIDGKATAAALREEIGNAVSAVQSDTGRVPGLAVVLVGEDAASQVYVRNKEKQTVAAGMQSFAHRLPETATQQELVSLVEQLNQNPEIHGILVQLPLPRHMDELAVIDAIAPEKDVDGFHVINTGKLVTGQDAAVPCTPLGCLMLIQAQLGKDLSGKHAVIIGRSNIVGKPMASLLLNANCTVTTTHSRTADLPALTRQADILVAAVGRPQMVQADWVKPGACVIDVGINRVENPDGTTKLVGDVNFDAVQHVAGSITPVPGGVGPMTIACLLRNTLSAFCRHEGIKNPLD